MTFEDYYEINQVVARYGHVLDEFAWERLTEVFTEDVEYDLSAFDRPSLHGVREIADAFGGRTIFAHHTTNLEITSDAADEVRAQSKFIGVMNERVVTGDYHDVVVRTPNGWRISSRAASVRTGDPVETAADA